MVVSGIGQGKASNLLHTSVNHNCTNSSHTDWSIAQCVIIGWFGPKLVCICGVLQRPCSVRICIPIYETNHIDRKRTLALLIPTIVQPIWDICLVIQNRYFYHEAQVTALQYSQEISFALLVWKTRPLGFIIHSLLNNRWRFSWHLFCNKIYIYK